MGDSGRVPGKLEPGGGGGLDLEEVGRGHHPRHLLPVPGGRRHVELEQGGGQGGPHGVAGHHKEPVEGPGLQVGHRGFGRGCVDLLKNRGVLSTF